MTCGGQKTDDESDSLAYSVDSAQAKSTPKLAEALGGEIAERGRDGVSIEARAAVIRREQEIEGGWVGSAREPRVKDAATLETGTYQVRAAELYKARGKVTMPKEELLGLRVKVHNMYGGREFEGGNVGRTAGSILSQICVQGGDFKRTRQSCTGNADIHQIEEKAETEYWKNNVAGEEFTPTLPIQSAGTEETAVRAK
ncbi:hypothetical protein R3P38DRAFT_2780765 [Favolaschia claudopus]|uniref:Lipoprotein n=1 Tax=Favolaschia claudopus TaxID=2862362 RepID=A0AAW0B5Z7_9AGAR